MKREGGREGENQGGQQQRSEGKNGRSMQVKHAFRVS